MNSRTKYTRSPIICNNNILRLLKKISLWLICLACIGYIIVCGFFYSIQQKVLFGPTKLPANYQFTFPGKFTERKIVVASGITLDALLFKADSSKGVVLYLHGNGGALDTWGSIAELYTSSGYDVFLPDYRGYGKSEGKINSQQQFFDDVQACYNDLLTMYPENKIIVQGYSIGTCPAAMLAAHNHPKLLILQAPYYSMVDMMKKEYSFLPSFLLKYPLNTDEYVKVVKAPIIIFHGDADRVIYCGSSLKLQKDLKPGDSLIILKGQGHAGFTENAAYVAAMKTILKQ